MWVRLSSAKDEIFEGELLSTPGGLKIVKFGDIVNFGVDQITDWLNVVDEKAQGSYRVKLIRSRMSAAERAEHDSGYSFSFD